MNSKKKHNITFVGNTKCNIYERILLNIQFINIFLLHMNRGTDVN